LNYEAKGSRCYANNESNCQKYGRLYDGNVAMKVCPKGWHLPSEKEWTMLTALVGGEETEGKHLKAKSGWKDNGNGLDSYGFAALPGGSGTSEGDFTEVGEYGYWWTTSKYNIGSVLVRIYSWIFFEPQSSIYVKVMDDYDGTEWFHLDKRYLFSVRCLRD